MMRSQRRKVISSGFSTMTCFPARAAASAGSRCAPLGVHDGHYVDFRVGQQSAESGVVLAVVGLGESLGRGRIGVETADDTCAADITDGLGVEIRNHAAANDAKPVGHGTPPLFFGFLQLWKQKVTDSPASRQNW